MGHRRLVELELRHRRRIQRRCERVVCIRGPHGAPSFSSALIIRKCSDAAWQHAWTSSPLLQLSRDQRADLFAGRLPRIAFPANRRPEIKPGTEYRLSSHLTLKANGFRRSKNAKEVELDYSLVDNRPLFLRARLPRHSDVPDERDPDALALRQAAIDSAYTGSRQAALEPLEAVPPAYEKELVMRNRVTAADHSRQRRDRAEQAVREQVQVFARELRQTAVQMVRAGADPDQLFADVKRQISEAQHELRQGGG